MFVTVKSLDHVQSVIDLALSLASSFASVEDTLSDIADHLTFAQLLLLLQDLQGFFPFYN